MQPPASLWWSTLDEPVVARRALTNDVDVDVAIVGGGFTGLWHARELLRRAPDLRVAVVERHVCGFGASGRNGGWASALYPLSDAIVERHYGEDAARHLRRTLHDAVADLGRAAHADGLDIHFHHGGTVVAARSDVQAARLRASVEDARAFGLTASDLEWLDADPARERLNVTSLFGATFTPHCARIHPARLVRGLARVLSELGVAIYENTPATRILGASSSQRARVVTPGGTIRADYVIRATEGFTPTVPHERRTVVPLYSLMVATEPLPEEFWSRAGLADYETFADDRHLVIYGQRTADQRLAFGGRGAPYHFGSTVEARFDHNSRVFALIEQTLRELFPYLDAEVSHRWGGPLAMPRDQSPFVRLDHRRGLGEAGGYTGDGVVLSRVAAAALADLIVTPDEETALSRLAFVQHPKRRWEFEPLRWAGINAGLGLATWADRVERRHHRESRASGLLDRLFDQFPP